MPSSLALFRHIAYHQTLGQAIINNNVYLISWTWNIANTTDFEKNPH